MNSPLASGTRRFRKVLPASSAALVLMASAVGVGAYTYLKAPAAASGTLAVVPLITAAPDDQTRTDASSTLYAIESGASQATFTIDEVLRGSPKTVVGTILVDARTLETDDSSSGNWWF